MNEPMNRIFLWFYCLPIAQALLIILLVTAAWLLLRHKFGNCPFWRAGVALLFMVWIAVILLGTLGQRTGGEAARVTLTPFASYFEALNGGPRELYRTNFMNAVLFYPAGLLGFELLPKRWKRTGKIALLAAVFALMSTGIEYCQYRFGLGLAETDDVIHNALGAALGGMSSGVSIPGGKSK